MNDRKFPAHRRCSVGSLAAAGENVTAALSTVSAATGDERVQILRLCRYTGPGSTGLRCLPADCRRIHGGSEVDDMRRRCFRLVALGRTGAPHCPGADPLHADWPGNRTIRVTARNRTSASLCSVGMAL